MNEQPSQESGGVMKGMRGLMWLGIGAALTVGRGFQGAYKVPWNPLLKSYFIS